MRFQSRSNQCAIFFNFKGQRSGW